MLAKGALCPRAITETTGVLKLECHRLIHRDFPFGQRKRENIKKSQCAVVATGCPACMLQITDMLSQAGDQVQVRHAIEIYAESL